MITKGSQKVLNVFFSYPEKKFHIRELARLTGLSSTGVIKIVAALKKKKLLTSKKERMVEIVQAARNYSFLSAKRAHNLASMYNTKLVSYLQNEYEEPDAIVLFGSYAVGDDTSKSDIDIAIISKVDRALNLTSFERKLNRKINLMALSDVPKKFKNSLANGIVLEGYLVIEKNG